MKKYIKPQIEVTTMETMEMLCESGNGISNKMLENKITNSNDILSKDYKQSIWGYDEDEE